jgi:hypothetical protein
MSLATEAGMKPLSILAVVLLLMAANALGAGSENIIKQRAKDLRDQNNARQGVPPPAQPVAPAYSTAPASSSRPASAQPANPALPKLQATLESVKRDSTITDQLKSQAAADLLAVAQGRKPSEATTAKLAQELLSALAEKPLESKRLARVVQNLGVVLNAGKSTPAKVDDAVFTMEATFQAEGLARAKAAAIAKSAKSVAEETMPGAVQ